MSEKKLPAHIGNYLTKKLKEENKTFLYLANVLGMSHQGMFRYKHKRSVQTDLLWDVCYALEDNIFARIGEILPFAHETETEKALKTENEALQSKIEKLELVIKTLKSRA